MATGSAHVDAVRDGLAFGPTELAVLFDIYKLERATISRGFETFERIERFRGRFTCWNEAEELAGGPFFITNKSVVVFLSDSDPTALNDPFGQRQAACLDHDLARSSPLARARFRFSFNRYRLNSLLGTLLLRSELQIPK